LQQSHGLIPDTENLLRRIPKNLAKHKDGSLTAGQEGWKEKKKNVLLAMGFGIQLKLTE